MDSYEKKHEMMSQLLDMLRKHASDEVDSGLRKPEGEGDMHGVQIEKVEVLPEHEMDEPTPSHEVDTKMVPEEKSSVLDALETREPSKPDARAEEAKHQGDDGEESTSSMFSTMFGKKKKK